MTKKVYKSAMGKSVDLGALLLQNEQVRAVGNMGVNAAGDLVDNNNRVIDHRNKQVNRQYRRQTNVSDQSVVATSNVSARKLQQEPQGQATEPTEMEIDIEQTASPFVVGEDSDDNQPSSGGLAAAIARSREVKQELEKSLRQRQQSQGLRKI
jgi:hypothetical protein